MPPLGHDHADDHAQNDPARDPEAAVPDLERVDPVPVVALPVGDDVVQPRADQAGRDGPHGDGTDVVRVAAAGFPPPASQSDGRERADRDHQAVHADVQWPEVQNFEARTGNAGQDQ